MQAIDFVNFSLACIFLLSVLLDFLAKYKSPPIFYLLSAACSFLFLIIAIFVVDDFDSLLYVFSFAVFVNMISSIYRYINRIK